MPISQFTQPAQGTYQQSYVQPPTQQLGQIGQTMQKQQDQQRQAAQEFVSNLQGLGLGGGDVPRAEEKIGQVQQAVNQLAEEQGYNLRSPEFKSKFQNLRTSVKSDPFWSIAPEKKEQAEEVRQRLQDYGHNLPSSVVNRAREQLGLYEQFGSIDPRTGRPIQFDTVPEEVQDPSEYIGKQLIGDPRPETIDDFTEGVARERTASLAGLTWDSKKNQYRLEGEIPQQFEGTSAGRELTRQAQHLARKRAADEGKDSVSSEEVRNIKRDLYEKYASRQAEQKAGSMLDYATALRYQQTGEEEEGLSNAYFQMATEFGNRLLGEKYSKLEGSTIHTMLGTGGNGEISPQDYVNKMRTKGEERPIVIDPAFGFNAQEMAEAMDQVEKYNKLENSKRFLEENLSGMEDISMQNLKNLQTQFSSPGSGGGIEFKETNKYRRIKDAFKSATGYELEEAYPNASEKLISRNDEGKPTQEAMQTFDDIRSTMDSGIESQMQMLPEDIDKKSQKIETAEALGKDLSNLPGTFKFEPFQWNNKMITESGEVFLGGNIIIEKDKAEDLLKEEGFDISSLEEEGIIETHTPPESDTEYIKLDSYFKAPTDTKTLTDAFSSEYSRGIKGSLGEDYTAVQNRLRDVIEMLRQKRGGPSREDLLNNQ